MLTNSPFPKVCCPLSVDYKKIPGISPEDFFQLKIENLKMKVNFKLFQLSVFYLLNNSNNLF